MYIHACMHIGLAGGDRTQVEPFADRCGVRVREGLEVPIEREVQLRRRLALALQLVEEQPPRQPAYFFSSFLVYGKVKSGAAGPW